VTERGRKPFAMIFFQKMLLLLTKCTH